MIYKEKYIGDIYCPTSTGENIYFYGEDVKNIPSNLLQEDWKNSVIKYLYKDCIDPDYGQGIIIGFEINNQYLDYYYRVYIPELNKVVSTLANDASFVKSIKL